MGADNTFGETNFNPNPKTKVEMLADAFISDMTDAGLSYDAMLEVLKIAKTKYELLIQKKNEPILPK